MTSRIKHLGDDAEFQREVDAGVVVIFAKGVTTPITLRIGPDAFEVGPGEHRGIVGEPGDVLNVSVSPDGKNVDVSVSPLPVSTHELARLYEDTYVLAGTGSSIRLAHVVGLLEILSGEIPWEGDTRWTYNGEVVLGVLQLCDLYKAVRLPSGELRAVSLSDLEPYTDPDA